MVVVPSIFKFPLILTSFKYVVLLIFKIPYIVTLLCNFVVPDTFKLVTLKFDKSIDAVVFVVVYDNGYCHVIL